MEKLTQLSHKETIVMRIITIVTLIFLPATFVSVSILYQSACLPCADRRQTLFSTDIVKYQNTDANGSFSLLALERWLEVTLPLTFLTIAIGLIFYRLAKVKSQRELLPFHNDRKWG